MCINIIHHEEKLISSSTTRLLVCDSNDFIHNGHTKSQTEIKIISQNN